MPPDVVQTRPSSHRDAQRQPDARAGARRPPVNRSSQTSSKLCFRDFGVETFRQTVHPRRDNLFRARRRRHRSRAALGHAPRHRARRPHDDRPVSVNDSRRPHLRPRSMRRKRSDGRNDRRARASCKRSPREHADGRLHRDSQRRERLHRSARCSRFMVRRLQPVCCPAHPMPRSLPSLPS